MYGIEIIFPSKLIVNPVGNFVPIKHKAVMYWELIFDGIVIESCLNYFPFMRNGGKPSFS